MKVVEIIGVIFLFLFILSFIIDVDNFESMDDYDYRDEEEGEDDKKE